MKTSLASLSDLSNIGWFMLLGNSPADPAKQPAAKAAPRSPTRRAAPAKKSKATRKAKGAKRR